MGNFVLSFPVHSYDEILREVLSYHSEEEVLLIAFINQKKVYKLRTSPPKDWSCTTLTARLCDLGGANNELL